MKSGAKALSENGDEGTDITVTGRLEIYEKNGFSYLHLVDAEVLWEEQP